MYHFCPCSPYAAGQRAMLVLVRRFPQFRRYVRTFAALLLERHLPDAFDMERTAPPRQYLGQLADIVHEARHARRYEGIRRKSRRANEHGEMPCTSCGQYYPTDWFSKNSALCKECRSLRSLEYHRTLRGNTCRLVISARSRSRKKGLSCNLRRDDILEMLLEQEGRCHYSKIPMEILFPHSNWRMVFRTVEQFFRL